MKNAVNVLYRYLNFLEMSNGFRVFLKTYRFISLKIKQSRNDRLIEFFWIRLIDS